MKMLLRAAVAALCLFLAQAAAEKTAGIITGGRGQRVLVRIQVYTAIIPFGIIL